MGETGKVSRQAIETDRWPDGLTDRLFTDHRSPR